MKFDIHSMALWKKPPTCIKPVVVNMNGCLSSRLLRISGVSGFKIRTGSQIMLYKALHIGSVQCETHRIVTT